MVSNKALLFGGGGGGGHPTKSHLYEGVSSLSSPLLGGEGSLPQI